MEREQSLHIEKYKVISSVFAEIAPVEGLTIRSQLSIDYTHGTVRSFSMPSYAPNNGQGRASRNSSDAFNFTITNTASYKFDIDNLHRFNFMAGQEGVSYRSEGFRVSTAGQSNDLLYDVSSATRATKWANSTTAYTYLSFFGRGEYSYDNRYLSKLRCAETVRRVSALTAVGRHSDLWASCGMPVTSGFCAMCDG